MATTVVRVSPALIETAREEVEELTAAGKPVSPELRKLAAARLNRDATPQKGRPAQG